ncbi:AraC family transcriptional regulator [Kerstersia sp.]|uniref:AraC family transcriptional regulator n=1 Tax=Kerstersia sp. TaxID=1930783 RepID=UPI003F8DCBDA
MKKDNLGQPSLSHAATPDEAGAGPEGEGQAVCIEAGLGRGEQPLAFMTGVAMDYPAAHATPWHAHERCQLLYAVQGVMVVQAATGRWTVPPTTAVWLRPEIEHRLLMQGAVKVRSVFVTADAAMGLPERDGVLHVSALLRELIAQAAQLGLHVCATRRGRLLAELLLEELRGQHELPFHLPWPEDTRMAAVCEAVLADPANSQDADGWARALAMSSKTFQRHFRHSAGLGFGRWRQQARMMAALDALLQGQAIAQVALQAGYESQSAFTLAFRHTFGVSPARFRERMRSV